MGEVGLIPRNSVNQFDSYNQVTHNYLAEVKSMLFHRTLYRI